MSSNSIPINYRNLASHLIEVSKPSIIYLLDFVAISALLIAYLGEYTTNPISFNIVAGLLIAGTLSSAGSAALNCYLDRDIDIKMERTKNRASATGQLSPNIILIYGIIMITIAAIVSTVFLNLLTTGMILLGSFFYVFIYTIWLKRRTTWNIVIGGFAGSAAAFAGWTAITGQLNLIAILMGTLVFIWTPSHFWALALLKDDDYTEAGIPMLPVVVGKVKAARYTIINTLLLIPFSLVFVLLGFGYVYLVISVIFGILLLYSNVKLLKNPADKKIALTAFKFSSPYLAIIFIALILDILYRIPIF
ncbi:MAG: protoheme IX farnesyltransferase [Thaumarchaeota archaeon]|nr:protoheme IX farnesyltransferase [Nitrososphaerota archaeon]